MCTDRQLVIDKQSQRGADKARQIKHGTLQRDELLNNYVGAQKLAIAIGRDSRDWAKAKAFRRLVD